jgi:ABC-type transporter Mla subunit MlaD
MTMTAENLKESLKRLHANLESTGQVDPELKSLLKVLDDDIHKLLTQEARDAPEASALAEQAQSISARFAAQHPRIEPVLRDLANILASMGI